MFSLFLLAMVGQVVVAVSNPQDFSRLCSSPAPGGECPAGWKNVGGDCIIFAGWEKDTAMEVCREKRAEYKEYVMMPEYSEDAARYSLPVCLVRRETQCQCGRANRKAKIMGGVKAEKNEYPWQVRLSISNAKCGGSIISRDRILTAAHCTEGHSVGSITVFTRDHDRTRDDGEESHEVCGKREHPEYNKYADMDKDVAILNLCKPLMFEEAVGPICLPDPAQDYENVRALVTGSGRLTSNEVLIEVTTMTNQQCRGKFTHRSITDNMICATGIGRDSCQGDGGGPLAVPGQDGYVQIGVVSGGEGCAKPGYPGVYTRLTSLFCWVTIDMYAETTTTTGILITGGGGAYTSAEVYRLSTGQSCVLPSLPDMRHGHTITSLTLCGGSSPLTSCISFSSGVWVPSHSLAEKRRFHTTWEREEGVMLMGGEDSPTTTELLTEGSEEGVPAFSLQYSTESACSIPDPTTGTLVMTGGYYTRTTVSRYGAEGYQGDLPPLKEGRYHHGCGAYLGQDGGQVLLVAGGSDGRDYLSSTELLARDATSWEKASPLPRALHGLRGVTAGGLLYMTGGYDADDSRAPEVLAWHPAHQWVEVGMMKMARYYHAVTTIRMDDEAMQFCG